LAGWPEAAKGRADRFRAALAVDERPPQRPDCLTVRTTVGPPPSAENVILAVREYRLVFRFVVSLILSPVWPPVTLIVTQSESDQAVHDDGNDVTVIVRLTARSDGDQLVRDSLMNGVGIAAWVTLRDRVAPSIENVITPLRDDRVELAAAVRAIALLSAPDDGVTSSQDAFDVAVHPEAAVNWNSSDSSS
jgi:hypothetical protein